MEYAKPLEWFRENILYIKKNEVVCEALSGNKVSDMKHYAAVSVVSAMIYLPFNSL